MAKLSPINQSTVTNLSLNTDNVVEGTSNVYYTDARVQAYLDTLLGLPNGIATLDGGGLVPSAQLPSFVDDVLEFTNLAAFPATGEAGKIYVALDTNRTYRWSGTTYIEISSGPATTDDLPEGTTNLYYLPSRVQADETTTSITRVANDIVYTDEDGVNTNVDLTQTAAQVLVTPSGNLTSVNVQAALLEHQSDIDALTSGAITDHGALTGLLDDDHTQYLTETRHDSLPFDNPHNVNATQVGLGNVDNTSDADKPVSTAQQAALDLKYDASNPNGYETPAQLNARDTANRDRANHTGTQLSSTISDFNAAADARITAQKGVANGLATLDAGGLIPSGQLPGFVDDVLEFANLAAFPATGETGKIYVALDTNLTYRWSGTTYIEIGSSGVTDHGALTGLTDDDHPQYLTETRGDLRYYTQTQLDGGQLDNRYYTETEVDNLIADFETSAQLDVRDTNNRNRANHTGTQLASTISDFAAQVDADETVTSLSYNSGTNSLDFVDEDGTTNNISLNLSNGYTIFPIWAEENGALANNSREWSFGNGATGAVNIVLPIEAELFAVTFDAEVGGAATVTFDIMKNDAVAVTTGPLTVKGSELLTTPESFVAGDCIGFQTNTETGTVSDGRVCAWFRIPASPLSGAVLGDLGDVDVSGAVTGDFLVKTATGWGAGAYQFQYLNLASTDNTNINTQAVDSPYIFPSSVVSNNGATYNTGTGVITLTEGTWLLEGVVRLGNMPSGQFAGNIFKQVTGLVDIGNQSVSYANSATNDFTSQFMSQGVVTVAAGNTLDVAYYLDFSTVPIGTLQWNPARSFVRVIRVA